MSDCSLGTADKMPKKWPQKSCLRELPFKWRKVYNKYISMVYCMSNSGKFCENPSIERHEKDCNVQGGCLRSFLRSPEK